LDNRDIDHTGPPDTDFSVVDRFIGCDGYRSWCLFYLDEEEAAA